MTAPRQRHRKRHILLLILLVVCAAIATWHMNKPLPDGLHVAGPWVTVDESALHFLADITSVDNFGNARTQQTIHGATLELVRNARDFLLLDYFLFNAQGGPVAPVRYDGLLRPVALELRSALRALRTAQPQLPIVVMVDPINDYYRGTAPAELAALEQEGIEVVVTNLDLLRDSNPLYSATWRLLAGWWLQPGINGRWSNPLDAAGPDLTLGAITRIPHFKANHRKVILTGDGSGSLRGIVSSANPHDASSAHSNVALQLAGEALRPLLRSELAIARASGWRGQDRIAAILARTAPPIPNVSPAPVALPTDQSARAAIATEAAIRETLIEAMNAAGASDAIDIAQFYLSDRLVIEALLGAARRGVAIRVLLDPNKDAFGFEKSGLPNREVASELIAASDGAIRLRWYRTHGEQFHSKIALIQRGNRLWNVLVDVPAAGALAAGITAWFDTLWSNRPGTTEYSADAEVYADPSQGRYWQYRIMEATGLSTF
jgi:hypothetical protein